MKALSFVIMLLMSVSVTHAVNITEPFNTTHDVTLEDLEVPNPSKVTTYVALTGFGWAAQYFLIRPITTPWIFTSSSFAMMGFIVGWAGCSRICAFSR